MSEKGRRSKRFLNSRSGGVLRFPCSGHLCLPLHEECLCDPQPVGENYDSGALTEEGVSVIPGILKFKVAFPRLKMEPTPVNSEQRKQGPPLTKPMTNHTQSLIFSTAAFAGPRKWRCPEIYRVLTAWSSEGHAAPAGWGECFSQTFTSI